MPNTSSIPGKQNGNIQPDTLKNEIGDRIAREEMSKELIA